MRPVELGAPALACVLAIGALAGAVSLALYRRWTDATQVKKKKNQKHPRHFEIRLFADEPRIVLRAQRNLILENLRFLRLIAKPTLLLTVPFILLIAALEMCFAHAPLRVGQPALVTVRAASDSRSFEAPAGIAVDQPPVFVTAENNLVWRIRPQAPVRGAIRVNGMQEKIAAGSGFVFSGWPAPVHIAYPRARIFHLHWLWWFLLGLLLGAVFMWSFRFAALLVLVCLSVSCAHPNTKGKVIVLGVDGMDPAFVERHWDALPNLKALKDTGYFGRLRTTDPPQSPVAWSSFITGLTPDRDGIYDFVHRDPATGRLFSSMSKTADPKFVLPLGPYLLPLSSAPVSVLRHGEPFWRTLADRNIPVIVQHMPVNFPPEHAGTALSGMGAPDLLGTLGTFTFFTDDPVETNRAVSGGRIVKTQVGGGRAELKIEGPSNPLRKDHAPTAAAITLDIDPSNDVARITLGDQAAVIEQGEWSSWLKIEFPLIAHLATAHGIVRLYAKELHPGLAIYVSPINLDPADPALPISWPSRWAAQAEDSLGGFSTLGIPEDTSALRQDVFTLAEFRAQAENVFHEDMALLDRSLREYHGGFFFFYFSSVDQNSHVLWGKHEDELLKVYREIDEAVGLVRRREPDAKLLVISDHGFTNFDHAVNLNTWLNRNGFANQAYAVGLNGLYVNLKGREYAGTVTDKATVIAKLRSALLAWRDPENANAVVVQSLTETAPAPENRSVAPDLIVGYAAGYRASWQTGLGESGPVPIEPNNDAWIGDHCVAPAVVPGVLFSSERIQPVEPRLEDVTAAVLTRFALPPPAGYHGHPF